MRGDHVKWKKREIPEILNLSAVLGVKGNEAGGKADFIEQDSKLLRICAKRRNFEFSANFFIRYPDFCEKNVRCIVREVCDNVNRNFTIAGVSPFVEEIF